MPEKNRSPLRGLEDTAVRFRFECSCREALICVGLALLFFLITVPKNVHSPFGLFIDHLPWAFTSIALACVVRLIFHWAGAVSRTAFVLIPSSFEVLALALLLLPGLSLAYVQDKWGIVPYLAAYGFVDNIFSPPLNRAMVMGLGGVAGWLRARILSGKSHPGLSGVMHILGLGVLALIGFTLVERLSMIAYRFLR